MASQGNELPELVARHGGVFAMIVRNEGRYTDANYQALREAQRAAGVLLDTYPFLNTEECVMCLVWMHLITPVDEWRTLQAVLAAYESLVVLQAFQQLYRQLEPHDGAVIRQDVVEEFRQVCREFSLKS